MLTEKVFQLIKGSQFCCSECLSLFGIPDWHFLRFSTIYDNLYYDNPQFEYDQKLLILPFYSNQKNPFLMLEC